jgi:hypothetical protein
MNGGPGKPAAQDVDDEPEELEELRTGVQK